ncbi:PREDICTED: sphingosine kinase 2-like isoform X1 [Amphimedon queenslandica]|uniref:DAGKc domain-containing protein n=1 Tax=Amphimedon queenslandica TaxID=400682 RepID=A0AAN0J7C9_AMPQE|nr:PREDICTED: sphingosine kinase 2-like isoform X1 [Amphimedon queenslandica]|eukprot:XP_019852641.1 PREDICTED: sphingosine kinase 2-like isoform X1 [Amphimedon queenslandica]
MAESEQECLDTVVKSGSVLAPWLGVNCTLLLKQDSLACVYPEATAAGSPPPLPIFAVKLEDVVGLKILQDSPFSSSPSVCRAELCTYQKVKRFISSSYYRKFSTEILEFSDAKDFETNYKTAKEWRESIQLQCRKNSRNLFVFSPEQIDRLEPMQLLVIINPFSGRKNGQKLFQNIARPMFDLAGAVIVQEVITERQGHAKEFVETFDLTSITGIVLASGDGIVYEVINGLMARPDWETAIKTPIGLIPTGSGNALVSSLLYEADEEVHTCAIENAVFQIINGGIKQHDIASVCNSSSHSYIGVVIHWGMTGIVDVESEKLRFLGGKLRNLIGGLVCIVMKRSYYGQLSYLPIEEDETKSPLTEAEGSIHSTNTLKPTTDVGVSDPIPEHWKTIEGNFVIFMALTSSHVTENDMMCAETKTGSGKFKILYTFDDVTRGQLLAKLSESTGAVKIENFHEIHTRAFRLNPISPCIITVDGEQIDYGPIQVQMHPGMMRLYSRVRCE